MFFGTALAYLNGAGSAFARRKAMLFKATIYTKEL
jgi:hypothetical protein